MPLHPQAQAIADLMAASGAPALNEQSPQAARAMYEAMRVPSTEEVHEIRDVDASGIPCRLYRPSSDVTGLLLYFHGGGWVIGSVDTHDGGCRSLANRTGHAVLSVDYRLAPEHKYPAALEDCLTALRWAHENADSLGVDATRLAVGGDSAGGHLAALVAQLQPVPLKFQLLVYPVTDAHMISPSYEENKDGPLLTADAMRWFWDHFIGGVAQPEDPRVSPIMASDAVLASAPPALVITAEFDPLRDEGEEYGRRLMENGVNASVARYLGMFHGFFSMFAMLDDAHAAHSHAAALVKKALDA